MQKKAPFPLLVAHRICDPKRAVNIFQYTVKTINIFPSPAGMSLTKLSLVGNNSIIPGWGQENGKPFLQCILLCVFARNAPFVPDSGAECSPLPELVGTTFVPTCASRIPAMQTTSSSTRWERNGSLPQEQRNNSAKCDGNIRWIQHYFLIFFVRMEWGQDLDIDVSLFLHRAQWREF